MGLGAEVTFGGSATGVIAISSANPADRVAVKIMLIGVPRVPSGVAYLAMILNGGSIALATRLVDNSRGVNGSPCIFWRTTLATSTNDFTSLPLMVAFA